MSIELKGREVNELFKLVTDVNWKENDEYEEITSKDVKYYSNTLLSLVGYKSKLYLEGEHYNDYQIVTYCMTLMSPSGEVTEIEVERSLVGGWLHEEYELIIN